MEKAENHYASPERPELYRYVLNIFRMTTHNGPGIRTLIQFKGCPLRCLWCSTPESQEGAPELAYYPPKCIGCQRCASRCYLNAIKTGNERISIDRSLCDSCGRCAEVCTSEALKLLGQPMTVGELVEEVNKDGVFYRHSGGGVTLSGGEPLMNPRFTGKLLKALKAEEISVGVDTCGYMRWEDLEPMLSDIDFFLWDIKHMNPEVHKQLTGVSNELIISNAQAVSERHIPIYIRVPVIAGYNDSEENIRAVCVFARKLPSLAAVDLMPLHHLGKTRYESLARRYPISETIFTPDGTIQKIKQLVQLYGLKCNIVA